MSDAPAEQTTPAPQPDRGERGRFLKGHSIRSKGNPNLQALNKRREIFDGVLNEHCTRDDMIAIVQKAVTDARAGDRHARADLWNRYAGKPVQPIEGDINVRGGTDEDLEVAQDAMRQMIAEANGGPPEYPDAPEGGGDAAPDS